MNPWTVGETIFFLFFRLFAIKFFLSSFFLTSKKKKKKLLFFSKAPISQTKRGHIAGAA